MVINQQWYHNLPSYILKNKWIDLCQFVCAHGLNQGHHDKFSHTNIQNIFSFFQAVYYSHPYRPFAEIPSDLYLLIVCTFLSLLNRVLNANSVSFFWPVPSIISLHSEAQCRDLQWYRLEAFHWKVLENSLQHSIKCLACMHFYLEMYTIVREQLFKGRAIMFEPFLKFPSSPSFFEAKG